MDVDEYAPSSSAQRPESGVRKTIVRRFCVIDEFFFAERLLVFHDGHEMSLFAVLHPLVDDLDGQAIPLLDLRADRPHVRQRLPARLDVA